MAQVDRGGSSTTPPSPPPVFRWRGGWVTERLYGINDVLRYEGASYITLLDHTATDFFTDLATQKIELMVDKGLAGAGSGDMLGANNLSEIVSPSAARNNIGAASAATLATLDANKLAISSKASQAEAEAGTDNDNYMTALRTAQAIVGLAPDNRIGVGQTWQDVTGSRVANTTYTNSTGKPIFVAIYYFTASGSDALLITVGGVAIRVSHTTAVSGGVSAEGGVLIPAGATYSSNFRTTWWELR
jgi:hypothetical protein